MTGCSVTKRERWTHHELVVISYVTVRVSGKSQLVLINLSIWCPELWLIKQSAFGVFFFLSQLWCVDFSLLTLCYTFFFSFSLFVQVIWLLIHSLQQHNMTWSSHCHTIFVYFTVAVKTFHHVHELRK